MRVEPDDLSGPEILDFLEDHLNDMRLVSPRESVHALDPEGLRQPGITFWTVRDDGVLIGCGALKELDSEHAEIKSMRTSASSRGKGVATLLLQHILNEAGKRNYRRLSLETGSMAFFAPARALYARFGFSYCPPFAQYREDPNSVFMTKLLSAASTTRARPFRARGVVT